MAMYEVTWAERDEAGTHDAIRQVGGIAWRAPVQAVITHIEAGRHTYFIQRFGSYYLVAVERSLKGKHLRARAGSTWSDFLLELPEAPRAMRWPGSGEPQL